MERTSLTGPEVARWLAAQRKPKQLYCAVCGTAFIGKGRGRYCSPAHRQQAYYRARKAKEQP